MRTITSICLIFFNLVAVAQTAQMRVMPQKGSDTYKIYFTSDLPSDLDLTITNNKSNKEELKIELDDKDGFILPIDFSKFGSGEYTVNIKAVDFEVSETVTYQSQVDVIRALFESEVLVEEKKILLTLLEAESGDISLFVSGPDGELIKEETVSAKGFGMRAFDFSDSEEYPMSLNVYYNGQLLDGWTINE